MKLHSIIEAQQFDKALIEEIFSQAAAMEEEQPAGLLKGKLMASLFYEPSTRTRFSFEIAMKRLGGEVVSTENAREFSSAAKGESLEDTIRTINQYGVDVIVLRYHQQGGAARAQMFSQAPIINAGDGPGQHPTQALLDLYTIKKHFGLIKGLKIALVGDLANGRTVRSLCYFLAKHYPDNLIHLVSPKQVRMKQDIKDYLGEHRVHWQEGEELLPLIPELDIVYQTRVQQERFKENHELYEEILKASAKLVIDEKIADRLKPGAIIMHPLPRNTEIYYSVDISPHALYFKQAKNGLYIRMALLKMILT
jgi:aspartate carbamoyltransferase catalytic subunit